MEDENNSFNVVKGLMNPISAVLLLIQVIFIVLIIFIVNENIMVTDNGRREINASDSFAAVIGLTDISKENINEALYEIVAFNTDSNQTINTSSVKVRKDSLLNRRIDSMSMMYTSFIVDLDDLRQSYRIYYEQFDENDKNGEVNERVSEALVVCLSDEDEKIYEDFDCWDNESKKETGYLLSTILEYVSYEDFYAYIDDGDLNRIRIVSRYYNHTAEQDAEYVRQVREFVESLGISPELFKYYIVPVEELEIL